MTLTTPEQPEKNGLPDISGESKEPLTKQSSEQTSATTVDMPSFGWSGYAERINGRFAMIGFVAILLIEAISQETFLHWSGLIK